MGLQGGWSLNILHITTFLQGGAGLAIAELACSQSRAGHAVTVVASGTGERDYGNYPQWLERITSAGARLLLVESTFKRDLALHVAAFRAVAASLDCAGLSVIHTHAAIPSMLALLLRSRAKRALPVLQTMHGWGLKKDAAQAATDVTLMNALDCVATPSEASRRHLVRLGVASEIITVVPNGVGPVPDAAEDPRADRLRRWQSSGYKVLACIGSVGERKNQRLLVRAMADPRAPRDLACAIIGEGDEIPALREQARESGLAERIHFYGYQPDGERFLAAADWLVLPSNDEGMPLTVLEAYRAGVPVISSDIPELAEIVVPGQTGFLFTAGSVEDLARTLAAASGLPGAERLRMGNAARRLWRGKYHLDAMLDRYMRLYLELSAGTELRG